MAEEEVLEEQPKEKKKGGLGMLPVIALLAVVLVAVVVTFVMLKGMIGGITGTVNTGIEDIKTGILAQQAGPIGAFGLCESNVTVAPADENLTINTADGEHFMVMNFVVCFQKPFADFLGKGVADEETAAAILRPQIKQAAYEYFQKISYTTFFPQAEAKQPKSSDDLVVTGPAGEEGDLFAGIDEAPADAEGGVVMGGTSLDKDSSFSDIVHMGIRKEFTDYLRQRGLTFVSEIRFTNFIIE